MTSFYYPTYMESFLCSNTHTSFKLLFAHLFDVVKCRLDSYFI